MTVEELQVVIKAQTTSFQKEIKGVKQQLSGLEKSTKTHTQKISSVFSGIGKALGAAGIALGAAKIVSSLKDMTSEAIKTDAQMSNLNRTMGANKNQFMNWAKNQASAYGISEAAAIKYGNAYSNLISGFIGDTEQSTAYTKQLIETSAVIASKTGRTVEDVNERIRSGLLGSTEAIEDLGVNVNVGTLEMTDAFKKIADGRSWEKLTFYEQQQVRLFAIMEQSAQKYGTELGNNTSTKLMTFQAKLDNIKTSLGRAFQPLVDTVIPILTAFIDKIALAVNWITSFFNALAGKSGTESAAENVEAAAAGASNLTGNLENATEAAKELKKVTAGFDEMTIISSGQAVSSGGGAASGGNGVGAIGGNAFDEAFKEPDTSGIQRAADKAKEILGGVTTYIQETFAPSCSAWGEAFESLKEPAATAFESIKTSTSDLWENSLAPFGTYITEDYVPTMVNTFSETFAPIFSDVMSFAFEECSKDYDFMCKQIERATNDIIQPSMELAKTVSVDAMTSIKDEWSRNGEELLEKLGKFRDSFKEIWDNLYNKILKRHVTI